ncbi:Major facilitator superfamily domain general substrate transporter [Penicillium longicatenatum]|uniref:Major facilitator superfamily domain general substrate transporter n=1 Tax=Penicillium longicatenatum TaxID=1561947 RepID=UPI0025495E46|nr:Major facilitator superfamily domain general substrate transporter [Penicillium longicatenatum]KAJ5648807.1 Major facilitator superfamily domain general substrate transporter [Penicillium longicatenatum]
MIQEEPSGSIRSLPWLIWVVVVFGSISSAGFRFDQGWWGALMSSSQFIQNFGSSNPVTEEWTLSSQQQSLGTGLSYVGVIIGVFSGSPINERLGRRNTLYIQSAVVTIGIIIESTAQRHYVQFLIGKLLVYLGGGIATSVIPAYQGEFAPKSMRGLMVGTYNAFLMIGGFLATLIVYLSQHISGDWAWRDY